MNMTPDEMKAREIVNKHFIDQQEWHYVELKKDIVALVHSERQKQRERIINLIRSYWKFDNNQQPQSGYWDREDLIKAISQEDL